MIRPFSRDYPITQLWGENPAIYSKFGLKGHNGVDYGTPVGTEIIAPHDGTVKESAYDATGYGNYVKIENDREGSVLGHFTSRSVVVGQKVVEGQVVGKSGNTGFSTGAHLHWGYYYFPRNRNDGYAGFINQIPMLALYNYFKQVINKITSSQGADCDLKIKEAVAKVQKEKEDAIANKEKECQERIKTKVEEIKRKVIEITNNL